MKIYKKIITRPLNRVKFMLWPKFKLGVKDLVVAAAWSTLMVVISFLTFDKIWLRILAGIGLALFGDIVLLMGEPNRKTHNYIGILIVYLALRMWKKKVKHPEEKCPYEKVVGNELVYVKNKSSFVYRIIGNNISYNLDDEIQNKLDSFSYLFQSQNLTYQLVKQQHSFDIRAHKDNYKKFLKAKNLKIKKEILKDNIEIIETLGSKDPKKEKYNYSYYYLEFVSTSDRKLEIEKFHIEESLFKAGIQFYQLDNKDLAVYALHKYFPLIDWKTKILDSENINLVTIWKNELKKSISFRRSYFKQGQNFSRIIAIDKLPLYSNLSFLEDIFHIQDSNIFITIKNLENEIATTMINKAYREMNTRQKSGRNKLHESKENEIYLSSMEELMEEMQSQGEELKQINIYLIIYGKTKRELDINLQKTFRQIKKSKMKVDKLFMKQEEFFDQIDISDISRVDNRTSLEISSSALSQGWPFTGESFNDETGNFVGISENSGKPNFLDFSYRSQKKHRNQSNSMIFGTTSGGKTTFTKKLIKDEYARNIISYILDPTIKNQIGEYEEFTNKLQGRVIDVSGNKNNKGLIERINPLQVLQGDGESLNDIDWISHHFKFLNDFFVQLLYPGVKDVVIQMEYLKYAIQEIYKKRKISNEKINKLSEEAYPTITDLHKKLLSLAKRNNKEYSQKHIFQELSERLIGLTKKGADGMLWDGHTTLKFQKEDLVTFKFGNLIEGGNKRIIGAQSLLVYKYIIHNIYNRNKERQNNQVAITIDEAHQFINPENLTSVLFAFTMYKKIRKYNGWIRMTTQNINDFTADPTIKKETSAMLNNSEFIFCFHLKFKDIEDLDDLIKSGGGLAEYEKKFLGQKMSHKYLFLHGQYRALIEALYTNKEKDLMWQANWRDTNN